MPTATPGPVETNLSLKKKGTIDNWDVTVKKVAVIKKITNGKYRYFQAKVIDQDEKDKEKLVYSLGK